MPSTKIPSIESSNSLASVSLSSELFSLEQRMVFDGAGAAIMANELADTERPEMGVTCPPPPEQTTENQKTLVDALIGITPSAPSEIVFIQANLPNIDTLLEGIDPNSEIVLIENDADGLALIFSTMEQYDNIDAIHIISHGEAGNLSLGNTTLTEEQLNNYANEFSALGQSLSDNGDILIYGCDFGAGATGQQTIDLLSSLTNADVAASTDKTGHQSIGGDWELEIVNGTIDAAIAISSAAQADWAHRLADLYSDTQLTISEPSDLDSGESAAVTLATAGTATVQPGAGIVGVSEVLDTVWHYSETGNPGTIDLQFDLSTITGETGTSASDFALVISDNADPALGTTYKLTASGLDGNIVSFNLVDLPNGAISR